MSTKELEAYWEAREALAKELPQDPALLMANPAAMLKFYEHKSLLDAQLGKKDARALRAVILAAHVIVGESAEILSEMFPNPEGAPKDARRRIVTHCQKKLCFDLYEVLSQLVLSTTECLVPLKTEAQT